MPTRKPIKSSEINTLSFGNETLKRLQELAVSYGIPKDQIGKVVEKGLRMLMVAQKGNKVIVETPKHRLSFDPRKI